MFISALTYRPIRFVSIPTPPMRQVSQVAHPEATKHVTAANIDPFREPGTQSSVAQISSSAAEAVIEANLAKAALNREREIQELVGRARQAGVDPAEVAEIEKLLRTHPGNPSAAEFQLVRDLLNTAHPGAALSAYARLHGHRLFQGDRFRPEVVRWLAESAGTGILSTVELPPRPMAPGESYSPKEMQRVEDDFYKAAWAMSTMSQEFFDILYKDLARAGEGGNPKASPQLERALVLRALGHNSQEVVTASRNHLEGSLGTWGTPGGPIFAAIHDLADYLRGKDPAEYMKPWHSPLGMGPAGSLWANLN